MGAEEKSPSNAIEVCISLYSPSSHCRLMLSNPSRYILENQDAIATVSCLDSGKTKVDASFGEILVTVEKLRWTIEHGERALRPEKRPTSFLMLYKHNEVIWEPLGTVAACVSWK
jgi:acyl-CoA reductase-like NAD-dependent aldehyde dehydrogenase